MSIIRRAVEQIAQVMPHRGPDELRLSYRYLGQPVDRLDGAEKVTGAARFSAEYPVEGLVHASIVCSTIAKGVIERIETAPAQAGARGHRGRHPPECAAHEGAGAAVVGRRTGGGKRHP